MMIPTRKMTKPKLAIQLSAQGNSYVETNLLAVLDDLSKVLTKKVKGTRLSPNIQNRKKSSPKSFNRKNLNCKYETNTPLAR
jgi:hypothetical protein